MFMKSASGILSLVFLFCCVSSVLAQSDDSPRVEIFGGYSALRTNYEAELPNPPMPVVVAFDGKQTMHGFNVSATGYLTKRFGLTADVSVNFKQNKTPLLSGGNITDDIRVIYISGGAQYKFRNRSRVTPFARALAGVAVTSSKLTVSSLNVSDTFSSTDFALTLGGGVDVRVNKRLDVRVFQADYVPVFLKSNNDLGFGKTRADNLRFSFGVVLKY